MSPYDYELKSTLVTIQNLSMVYDGKQILKPINAEVKDIVRPTSGITQGQVIGILGPSGIGKTQFSRCLAGLQKPTTGGVTVEVELPDGSVVQKPVTAGLVGMVAQNYPLFEHRTILGNLLVALEHMKAPKAKGLDALKDWFGCGPAKKARLEKVREYLNTFGLADKANLYPSQLSGGQRQRVSIIQELLSSEHFIIMDEPFTGLDPIMKDKVCDLIQKVSTLNEKNTLFVVAHDIASLVAISDCLWLFGRDFDEHGAPIPGAYIKKQYNLIERGLAWRPNIAATREFTDFVSEVKDQFRTL